MPSSLPASETRSQAALQRAPQPLQLRLRPQRQLQPQLALRHPEPMQRSLFLLLSLLPNLSSAQSSQPSSRPSSAPSSQTSTQPSSQASQPTSTPKEEEESLEP